MCKTTKEEIKKEWKKDISNALKESVKNSIAKGIEDEPEAEVEDPGCTVTNGTISGDVGITGIAGGGTPSIYMNNSGGITTLSGSNQINSGNMVMDPANGCLSYVNTTNMPLSVDSISPPPPTYSHLWEPRHDITVLELALAIPYIMRDKSFFEGDPELHESYTRHFNIIK